MKMKYIIAHDLGTSGDKATLFAEDGRLIGSYTKEYEAHYFNGNWAEENAEDWWDAVCFTTSTLIRESKIQPEDIAETILFLASRQARMITGQVIKVSGGKAI